jgi:hypothetical protein
VVLAIVLAVTLSRGSQPGAATSPSTTSPTTTTSPAPGAAPTEPPSAPGQLAADIARAQSVIENPHSAAAELESAGRFEQLATRELVLGSARLRRRALAHLSGAAAATMHANLAAAEALTVLVSPQRHLPHWRIIAPPAPKTLLGYFRQAAGYYRIPWQDLAAIEFIETKFGRIRGLSAAGAEGPMQFLPSTWARYGRGNVNNPRDAIFAAARLLVANGARRDMSGALYHYNQSGAYVRAAEIYAARMKADLRAYFGYYYWQVLYSHVGGTVILPQGYPRVRPIALM